MCPVHLLDRSVFLFSQVSFLTGKLIQAMGFGPDCHMESIVAEVPKVVRGFYGKSSSNVVTGTRVGIIKVADFEWRFLLKDSPYFSKSESRRD